MAYKKIAVIILTLILTSPITFSNLLHHDFDPTVDGWYALDAWELEYCRKWGGSVEGGTSHGTKFKQPIYLSQLTISLQGEKIFYNITNQTTLFKASWYIEPSYGELDYKVYLTGDGVFEIGSGKAKNTNAGFGYYANYLNKSFTHVKLEYPNNYLEVPIVD